MSARSRLAGEYKVPPGVAQRGREKYGRWRQLQTEANAAGDEFNEFVQTVTQTMNLPKLRKGKKWVYHVDRGVVSDKPLPKPASP